jgi:hypothetical protein
VIYDKIKENTETSAMVARLGYDGTVNYSLNQVLMRSVNTSLVVLLPIASLLFFGGETLKDFAFAMFIGVSIGAYSSVFIAAPILTIFKGREDRYRQMEARRLARGTKGELPKKAVVVAEDEGEREEIVTVPAAASDAAAIRTTARTGGPSRPRPKSKRKPPAKRKRR